MTPYVGETLTFEQYGWDSSLGVPTTPARKVTITITDTAAPPCLIDSGGGDQTIDFDAS